MSRSLVSIAAGLMLLSAAVLVSGCAGALVGAGATVGVAAYSERGVEGTARDLKTSTAIQEAFFRADEMLPLKIGVEVYDGRVLLTGVASSEKMRAEAVRLAWATGGVRQVYNEIQLAGGGLVNLARDSWITTQLETKLTLDRDVAAVNYDVETVNGVIYLIGMAQSKAELDRVIAHARTIDYVKDVISHVQIKGSK